MRPGYGVLPCAVMDDSTLSIYAKMAYAVLSSFAGLREIRPGHKRLAEIIGCSERKVRDALIELRDHELIEWKVIPTEAGKISIYRNVQPWTGFEGPAQSAASPRGVRHQTTEGPARGAGKATREPTSNQSTASQADRFDEFWAIFPKKVAKVAARRRWDSITRTVDPQVLIDGATRYRDSVRGKDVQYVKQPDGWLHAGRWDDEQQAASRGGTDRRDRAGWARATGTPEAWA